MNPAPANVRAFAVAAPMTNVADAALIVMPVDVTENTEPAAVPVRFTVEAPNVNPLVAVPTSETIPAVTVLPFVFSVPL